MNELTELISCGETKFIEFKSTYTKTILKSISAFANYHSGKIFIGIDDDGTICGVENSDQTRLSLENAINDNITPKPYYEMELKRIDEKEIVVLNIYKGENTPYVYNKKAYKRRDTSSVEVDRYEYQNLILSGENMSFEKLDSQETDLEFEYVEGKFRKILGIAAFSTDLLKSLELMVGGKYNNAAALLSDKNPLNNSRMALIRYQGDKVSNIKDSNILENISLIEQFDMAMDFYNKHMNRHERIEDGYRMTIEEIPKVAYREAVANAIIHRDYAKGGDIKVEIFDSAIEIISPGGLPIGISESEFLEGRISIPRNKILADIFLRLKIIERLATGIRRIKEHYMDYSVSPQFSISENTVKIVLPNIIRSAEEGISLKKIQDDKAEKIYDSLDETEKLIVDHIRRFGGMKRAQVQELVGLKKTQTAQVLKNLQEKNAIVRIGSGKSIKYVCAFDERI